MYIPKSHAKSVNSISKSEHHEMKMAQKRK